MLVNSISVAYCVLYLLRSPTISKFFRFFFFFPNSKIVFLTPQFAFDRKRSIRYDVIDMYAQWIAANGIRGVLVNGSAGEGVCQRVEERKRTAERWLEASRKNDLTCMVHVGGTAVTSVRDLAEHAEENRADAVLCLPELFFKPKCEEDLVHYLKDVAEHCPSRPLFYYHFPAFTGVNRKSTRRGASIIPNINSRFRL